MVVVVVVVVVASRVGEFDWYITWPQGLESRAVQWVGELYKYGICACEGHFH